MMSEKVIQIVEQALPSQPRISIVIPCLQQGQFLEDNLRSLKAQSYENLEIIVVDAGSSDGTLDIVKKYEDLITHWISEPDEGQSDAISKGMAKCTGVWFNWLNGDDYLLPGALNSLAEISKLCPNANAIAGGRIWVSNDGQYVRHYLPWQEHPWTVVNNDLRLLPQESTFLKLDWLRKNRIEVNKSLHNVMDTALYAEVSRRTRPVYTTAVFAAMRLHDDQKGRNIANLRVEFEQSVLPILKRRSWCSRAFDRLMRFRLGIGFLMRFLSRLFLYLNLVKDIDFVVYSPEDQEWKKVKSRQWGGWF